MRIGQVMAKEFEQESKTTRAHLERIPEDKWDWQPHAKSYTLLQLSSHLVNILSWVEPTVQLDVFEFDPKQFTPYIAKDKNDLLQTYDKDLKKALELIGGVPDRAMMKTWVMKVGGRNLFEMPRLAVLRAMIISHTVHHRAQLGVYLRLNGVPVPKSYGPTSDEPNF